MKMYPPGRKQLVIKMKRAKSKGTFTLWVPIWVPFFLFIAPFWAPKNLGLSFAHEAHLLAIQVRQTASTRYHEIQKILGFPFWIS